LKKRAVRVKVPTAFPAWLGGRPCELIDISVTGVLGVLDQELPTGSVHPFRLGAEDETLELTARVVRVKPSMVRNKWQIALAFEDVTPGLQRAISSTVARLMAAPPRRPGEPGRPAK
jgi:hypothetical protein